MKRGVLSRFLRLLIWLLVLSTDQIEAKKIVVVGSVNEDTFLTLSGGLPVEGENLVSEEDPVVLPGGKGCTQAVAACRLMVPPPSHETESSTQGDTETSHNHNHVVSFVGQFGSDSASTSLQNALNNVGVDISDSGFHSDLMSGRGYVFVSKATGQVSAVVVGGSNQQGWKAYECAWAKYTKRPECILLEGSIDRILLEANCLLLQREIPESVNRLFAAKAKARNLLVLQDIGGKSDTPMAPEHMSCCDYLVPNETELQRLVVSCCFGGNEQEFLSLSSLPFPDSVVEQARLLQDLGARNVLVTLGRRGSILVPETGNMVYHQPCIPTPNEVVVDETGAGDCFRAAFAVALLEGQSLPDCLTFASAAGSLSVETQGAVPSAPSRAQVEQRCRLAPKTNVWGMPQRQVTSDNMSVRGGGESDDVNNDDEFPFLIGSRLNSMKDRPELWPDGSLSTPRDFVKRQATIQGLTCVDFNYPQHFHTWTVAEAKQALDDANLKAGAVCLRYPPKFARGAMNHPDPELRKEAVELTKEAARVAQQLGCNEVVVWSAFDGYDYPFQVQYNDKWDQLVSAFRECCDAFPDIKFSLEYKPTDENTRFFIVPSTGAALLLVNEVDRPNFGLTLDVGHMLMSGENPGQSIAMVGRANKLFGIQLNDGFTRLAAEDGLMFGSVHPGMALEIMFQLRRIGFDGHLYFDTFPQRSDPVKEAEYNIERVKRFWEVSGRLARDPRAAQICDEHDAIGALRLVDEFLGSS